MSKSSKSQLAKPVLDEQDENLQGPQEGESAPTSSEGPNQLTEAVGPYTYFGEDLLRSLIHGLQIQVPHGEEPSATAEKLLRLQEEIVLKAKQRGIIPA